jgi:hypothetical protein
VFVGQERVVHAEPIPLRIRDMQTCAPAASGSALGSMPGTIVLGLRAACSISGKVVLWLLVEDDLADGAERGEGVRPDFRHVQDVDGEGGGGGGGGGERLDVCVVGGVVAGRGGLEQVEGSGRPGACRRGRWLRPR